jgi:hypothetical protein
VLCGISEVISQVHGPKQKHLTSTKWQVRSAVHEYHPPPRHSEAERPLKKQWLDDGGVTNPSPLKKRANQNPAK